MCCFQRSSRGVGAASPGCSTQNFVAHKITQNLVAHKTLNDASHGPRHLFPVLYPVPLWQLILEDSSGQPVLHEIRKKKFRIPFCLPNSFWNWFNCSRGLKSFHENLTTHVEVSACTVSFVSSTRTWNSLQRVTVWIIPKFSGIRVRTVCGFQ